jgi:hypothetical protein
MVIKRRRTEEISRKLEDAWFRHQNLLEIVWTLTISIDVDDFREKIT